MRTEICFALSFSLSLSLSLSLSSLGQISLSHLSFFFFFFFSFPSLMERPKFSGVRQTGRRQTTSEAEGLAANLPGRRGHTTPGNRDLGSFTRLPRYIFSPNQPLPGHLKEVSWHRSLRSAEQLLFCSLTLNLAATAETHYIVGHGICTLQTGSAAI
jgi:hypothetical protein